MVEGFDCASRCRGGFPARGGNTLYYASGLEYL